MEEQNREVLNGIDRILFDSILFNNVPDEDFGLSGKRLGLITNHSGLTKNLISSIDIIKEQFDLRALFGPEHGVRGEIEAGNQVDTYTDKRTGLPVYSLYSVKPQSQGITQGNQLQHRPEPYMLEDIDMLLIDIQNIGCRFYTYESTMYNCMEECAATGKTLVVLDRINPINGCHIEGNILDLNFKSFVGTGPVTNRHGMTMGELARFYNKECNINCELKIISLKNWKREYYSDKIGFSWVNPSPNIPNIDCALLYPGTCIFEGTSVSEGRGTTRPFEQIGAPWLDAEALADTMNSHSLPGLLFRPASFLPSFSKHKGELCRGVQLHITDRNLIKPVAASVLLLKAIIDMSGEKFHWIQGKTGRYSIDILAGTDILRTEGPEKYLELCEEGAKVFEEKRRPYLLY